MVWPGAQQNAWNQSRRSSHVRAGQRDLCKAGHPGGEDGEEMFDLGKRPKGGDA